MNINFKQKIFDEVAKIPRGKVSTYKLIAQNINTKAYRAIGNILKTNADTKTFPCHRVIKSNGEIGGYFGKVDKEFTNKKIELLKSEGIEIIDNKIVNLEKYLHKD